MHKQILPLLILSCLLLPDPGFAQAKKWDLDPAHSNIYFDITHIFSTIRGRFDTFSTTFSFDPENLEQSSFAFSVDCASVNTNIVPRDKHLRSEDFFHVAKYPEMSFQSSKIEHVQADTYRVTGQLQIKKTRRTLTIPFVFHGTTDNPMQEGVRVAGFDASFSIDRLEYGVGNGKFHDLGVVGKDVSVTVSLEMLAEK
jgi:polyisoprenoid-binding protein YceI